MSAQLVTPREGKAERLARLIRIPTVTSAEDAVFTSLEEALRADYPLIHAHLELEHVGHRGLLYRWRGASAERPAVLMAHLDVVPVDPATPWIDEPFSGAVRDGIVWGRGALDDKGPLVVVLEAVENLLAAGFTPGHDIYLSFGGNEETFGSDAVVAADLLRERGVIPWIVIDEGGAIVDAPLDFVPVEAAMVGVAEKGIMTVRFVVHSDGGHASAPERVTSAGRLSRAILRLQRNRFPVHMPVPFREMLRSFEPHVGVRHRMLLRALRLGNGLAARALARSGGEPAALMHTTIVTTMLDGGSAHNVLPTELSAIANIRIALGESVQSTLDTLRTAIADDSVQIEVVEASEPSPLSPTDNAQFGLISAAVEATYPGAVVAPYIMMAATDSRHFHRYSPAVYRFAPLAMTAEQRASIHGTNEYVTVDSLDRGERFFTLLIQSLD